MCSFAGREKLPKAPSSLGSRRCSRLIRQQPQSSSIWNALGIATVSCLKGQIRPNVFRSTLAISARRFAAFRVQKLMDTLGAYVRGIIAICRHSRRGMLRRVLQSCCIRGANGTLHATRPREFYSGQGLEKQGHVEEIEFFRKMDVHSKLQAEEHVRDSGEPPIGVRWVDVGKRDEDNATYGFGLVAQEAWNFHMPPLNTSVPSIGVFHGGSVGMGVVDWTPDGVRRSCLATCHPCMCMYRPSDQLTSK